MQNWILYIFCFEILCFSGGRRFDVENQILTLAVWLLTCVTAYINRENEYEIEEWIKGVAPMAFLIVWTLVTTIVINIFTDFFFLSYVFIPLGMMIAQYSFDFYRVRDCLLRLLSGIMVVSIIVHIGYNLEIIPAELIDDDEKVLAMSLYFFNVGWGTLDFMSLTRFSSIYWEPGQCQIVIMYVLVLFSDDIQKHIYDIVYLLKKYGILVLAILLTGSTTGYIVFALFISSLLLFNRDVLSQRKLMPLFISAIFAIGVFSFFYFSDVVQSKLELSESIDDENSFAIRMADNLACFTVAIEHPIFGLGVNSAELNAELATYGNTTASNGWLFSAAQMGFTYIVIMFVAMYINLRRMNLGVLTFVPLLILILSQANEYATYLPYMWLYCCPFGSYYMKDCLSDESVSYNGLL
jgi:hypothetical protein